MEQAWFGDDDGPVGEVPPASYYGDGPHDIPAPEIDALERIREIVGQTGQTIIIPDGADAVTYVLRTVLQIRAILAAAGR